MRLLDPPAELLPGVEASHPASIGPLAEDEDRVVEGVVAEGRTELEVLDDLIAGFGGLRLSRQFLHDLDNLGLKTTGGSHEVPPFVVDGCGVEDHGAGVVVGIALVATFRFPR